MQAKVLPLSLRCPLPVAPVVCPRFFFSALRAVAGSFEERPAAEKPAGDSSSTFDISHILTD